MEMLLLESAMYSTQTTHMSNNKVMWLWACRQNHYTDVSGVTVGSTVIYSHKTLQINRNKKAVGGWVLTANQNLEMRLKGAFFKSKNQINLTN